MIFSEQDCAEIRRQAENASRDAVAAAVADAFGGGGGDSNPINWQGPWDVSLDYLPNDIVSDGNSSYICVSANTATEPPDSAWELLAAKGDTGATGSTGPTNISIVAIEV